MSEHSSIEWTHDTWNPWSGCTKISPGCANCYAAALPPSMRRGAEWGASAARAPASEDYWAQPLRWNRAAEKAGARRRVFCASVADVFEDRAELDPWRERLFGLIRETPNLDWLLLTKRPEVAKRWAGHIAALWGRIWIGASVENQQAADERIQHLLRVPAAVRFLSMEPLLGPVAIPPSLWVDCHVEEYGGDELAPVYPLKDKAISWVIVGGESGRRARPMHPEWARAIRDQCLAAAVPFFFKQWGEWEPLSPALTYMEGVDGARNGEQSDAAHWREFSAGVQVVHPDGRVQIPAAPFAAWWETLAEEWEAAIEESDAPEPIAMGRVGKHAAGRLLDGRTWDEVPR